MVKKSVIELLLVNLQAHFAYYRRSKLLGAFALLFLVIVLLTSLPFIFSQSQVETFGAMKQAFELLNWFLIPFSAGLGLFIVSSHLHDRNLKMVFTKPCPPWLWLASAFLSAVIVAFLIAGGVLAMSLALSLVWRAQIEAGLLFVSVATFAASVGMIAYLMFLGMIMNPVIAAVFALIFNPQMFYSMQLWTYAMINAGGKNVVLRALNHIFHFLYMALPMVRAFPKEYDEVSTALRVGPGQWKYAVLSLGYALALSALFYFWSLFSLQRKRLI